jgi:cysteine protease ATG4
MCPFSITQSLTVVPAIRALANAYESTLRVYSTGDGPDVYEDNFMKIAKPDGTTFHPTIILVGTRLGIDKITPVYWEALVASLQMQQSIGIAGWVISKLIS